MFSLEARDGFFKCLDQQYSAGLNEEQVDFEPGINNEYKNVQAIKKCSAEKKVFDKACPSSWVGHFIRKYNFERYVWYTLYYVLFSYKQQLSEQGLNVVDKNALGDTKQQ